MNKTLKVKDVQINPKKKKEVNKNEVMVWPRVRTTTWTFII